MEIIKKLLSGSDIVHYKLNIPKELPSSGWKEYCPSKSWLEQKQIQSSLEDKYSTIGVERIEKQNNLAQAEWISDRKKAKVLKKIGKHWEVVGHYEGNEDWLLPEEALYLIEINVLELFYGGVPVSVEHAYALLLEESNNCTLSEYRVYSYLSRRGYKLIRHANDITVTKYEKEIHLDQLLEKHKRNIPAIVNTNSKTVSKETINVDKNNAEGSKGINDVCIEEVSELSCAKFTKRAVSESEDVCIIEDNIEIIEIEDIANKKNSSTKTYESFLLPSKLENIEKQFDSPESLILIEDENEGLGVKQELQSDSSTTESDDDDDDDDEEEDDVIFVKSMHLDDTFYNTSQFSQNYSSRFYGNNRFNNNRYNHNFYNNRNPYKQRHNRYSYGRRNFRYRNYRYNNYRRYTSHQRQNSRFQNRNDNSNIPNIIIDSDDDSHYQRNGKRRVTHNDPSKKKRKLNKNIEIIDLCEERAVKNEPNEQNRKHSKNQLYITFEENNMVVDSDRKPVIETELQLDTANLDTIPNSVKIESSLIEIETRLEHLENDNESDIKVEKIIETKNLNPQKEVDSIFKILEITSKKRNSLLQNKIIGSADTMDIVSSESSRVNEDSTESESANIIVSITPTIDTNLSTKTHLIHKEPKNWQQYKEQRKPVETSDMKRINTDNELTPLVQLEDFKNLDILWKNLQIFECIDVLKDDNRRQTLKVSFDVYLPGDHFKKSLKMLPKFRIIIVNSADSLPSNMEIDTLKSTYQDGIPFLFALVCDDNVTLFYYDSISLPEYCH